MTAEAGEETGQAPGKRAMLSVIVCFYNEALNLEAFFGRILPILESLPDVDFELVCVNDGSLDDTYDRLAMRAQSDQRIKVLDLSRNFGKEAALTAGLDYACGDAAVPIDADLQDPPELIPRLVELWRQGNEVVLAHRGDRTSDSLLKRLTARWFYKIHNMISDVELPEDVGDFRLLDRKALDALKRMPENRRFMKGLFAWLGFKSISIDFKRAQRAGGESKLRGWRLWNLAIEGITSFSTVPLRIWTYLGLGVSTAAMTYGLWVVIKTVAGLDEPPAGYTTIVVAILWLGGLQLMGIGILGEYIGRIYSEAKRRPIYILRRKINVASAAESGPAQEK